MDSIDRMRAFALVAECGSFTVAAERLRTTPQNLSKNIKLLEDDLGVSLLNRTTRRVLATEAGLSFKSRSERLVEDYDELRASLKDEHANPRGSLYVTCPTTFGELYVVDLVREFADAYPQVTVELSLTDRFVSLIDEGFDLAIRIGSLPDSSLIARRLAPANVVICASPSYLDQAGIPEEPSDLRNHECIVDTNLRDGNRWPFRIDGRMEAISVDGRFRVNSATAVRSLALSGAGIALCPTYAVGDDLSDGRLRPVLEQFYGFELGIYAVYLQNRYLSGKVRSFVDFLARSLGPHPSWDR